MFEKRKLKKAAKEKARDLKSTQMAKELVDSESQDASDVRRTQNYAALEEMASWKNDVRENIGWIIVGTIILGVGTLVAGWEISVPMGLVLGFVTNIVVKRFHHPQYQWLLYIKMETDSATAISWVGIPYRLFQFVDRRGLTNTIETSTYGPVYLVNDMEVGPSGIPVAIRFSWMHFPEYQFLLKKRVYNTFVEYLNQLVITDFELNETLNIQSILMGREMTESRMQNINTAKTKSPLVVSKMTEEQKKKLYDMLSQMDLLEERGLEDDEFSEEIASE